MNRHLHLPYRRLHTSFHVEKIYLVMIVAFHMRQTFPPMLAGADWVRTVSSLISPFPPCFFHFFSVVLFYVVNKRYM